MRELGKCFLLFERKNKEYGDAISETGVLGACVALAGDVGKLRTMVIRNPTHGTDVAANVEDKLRDIAVQALIGLVMLTEGNYDGI